MQLIANYEFVDITCANCGCLFALTRHYKDQKVKYGGNFQCPNGHNNFYGETEIDRLKKQLAAETSRRAAAEAEVTKANQKLDRVKNGVCPECKRSFINLQRHMEKKHTVCK